MARDRIKSLHGETQRSALSAMLEQVGILGVGSVARPGSMEVPLSQDEDVKVLALHVPRDRYEKFLEHLFTLAERWDMEDFASVVMRLAAEEVERWHEIG